MNSDAETLRSFLLGLLTYFSPTVSSPSGGAGDDTGGASLPSGQAGEISTVAPQGAGDGSAVSSGASTQTVYELPPLSELGEMPAVQTHVQTLLKRRLQARFEQSPPLFPWETEILEYPVTEAQGLGTWLPQLTTLTLPTALPREVLATLLERCQALAQEALKPGIQLVRAVEDLFPEQPQTVNQIAGLVLAGATRDSQPARSLLASEEAFPQGYAGANPQQQVTLSMLAAQEILAALVIPVGPEAPPSHRHWNTTEGVVTLAIAPGASPTVTVTLPTDGSLTLGTQSYPATAATAIPLSIPAQPTHQALQVTLSTGESLTFTLTQSGS